ncbi:hypothetical protein V1512DRAFT_257820 [Lipomyces arxii]|uniref:uncharacterized protein n=1 Tax=Lipomyces arxii TaxID=56418 RepID=UPI0034CF59DF
MPIKLLHHKSYHVYNKDNIERVRRDEAEAKEKEEKEDSEFRDQDRRQRLEILRRRQNSDSNEPTYEDKMIMKAVNDVKIGGKRRRQEDEFEVAKSRIAESQTTERALFDETRSVNFFENEERGATEKDRKEKKLLNMRLDQPAEELRPWYTTTDMRTSKERDRPEWKHQQRQKHLERQKNAEDPLTSINMFLDQKARVDARRKQEARDRAEHVQRGTHEYYTGIPGSSSERSRHDRHERHRNDRGEAHSISKNRSLRRHGRRHRHKD